MYVDRCSTFAAVFQRTELRHLKLLLSGQPYIQTSIISKLALFGPLVDHVEVDENRVQQRVAEGSRFCAVYFIVVPELNQPSQYGSSQ